MLRRESQREQDRREDALALHGRKHRAGAERRSQYLLRVAELEGLHDQRVRDQQYGGDHPRVGRLARASHHARDHERQDHRCEQAGNRSPAVAIEHRGVAQVRSEHERDPGEEGKRPHQPVAREEAVQVATGQCLERRRGIGLIVPEQAVVDAHAHGKGRESAESGDVDQSPRHAP